MVRMQRDTIAQPRARYLGGRPDTVEDGTLRTWTRGFPEKAIRRRIPPPTCARERGRGVSRSPRSVASATQDTGNVLVMSNSACRESSRQGAGGGSRTLTGLRPGHCRCPASACFATPAPFRQVGSPQAILDATRQRAIPLAVQEDERLAIHRRDQSSAERSICSPQPRRRPFDTPPTRRRVIRRGRPSLPAQCEHGIFKV